MKILMVAIMLLIAITSPAIAAEEDKQVPFAIEGIPRGEYKIMTDEEMDIIKAPIFPSANYKSSEQQRKELLLRAAQPRH